MGKDGFVGWMLSVSAENVQVTKGPIYHKMHRGSISLAAVNFLIR